MKRAAHHAPPDAFAPTASAEAWRPARRDPPAFMFQPVRSHLLQRVEANVDAAKVFSIVAPVGYGKTVFMSMRFEQLRSNGKQCLWYTLDDRDTTVHSVIDALQAQLPQRVADVHPTQALFRGEEALDIRIERLMQALHRYPLPLTLFIDNLNCCLDPALSTLLDRLVFDSRPSIHLVLSSTRELPFDVSRAALQGLTRRIGPAELAFDADDIAHMLGQPLSQRIGRDGVAAIVRRTEGWPAAVRMVQIILANTDDPAAAIAAFSGADEGLVQLLNRVLEALPADVRDFLLRIAALRSFSLALCREAIGDSDIERHLAYLIERNIFVMPLDRNREWYRLHGLFRDFLLREAMRQPALAQRQRVLVRAARWCGKHGHWLDAVDYALASEATDVAAQIIDRIAPMFVRDRGHIPQYLHWVEQLRDQGGESGPEAEYWYVWALAFHRRYDTARQQVAALALRVQRLHEDDSRRGDLERRIAILRSSIDSLSDHLHEAHHGAAHWLATKEAAQDDPFNVTAANCIECCHGFSMYRFVEARHALQAARESAFQAASVHVDGWVASYAALVAIHQGEYAEAYRELVVVLAAARGALGEDAGICGTMAMVAAKCAVEMGLIEETRQLLAAGFRTARNHGFLEAAACGLEAAMLLWRGDDDAETSIAQLRDIAACYPPRLSWMLSCYQIQRLIVLGHHDAARAEAGKIGLAIGARPPHAPGADIASMRALIDDTALALMVAGGHLAEAEQRIASSLRDARASGCAARQVALALTAADVALRSRQNAAAVRHITRAVSVAAPHAIVRPFLDHAATFAAVVADTKVSAWGFATEAERRFFAERCKRLSFDDTSLQERVAALHDEEPHLAAKLTARELELLGYIEAGLSNQQIADRIDVALTTVKWHLQNLFAKLSVANRSAALAKARVLKLI